MPSADLKFMTQALHLARLGGRDVAPNPMVGAVIVKNGKVIGQGYHQKFGGPHAEVNAIRAVKKKSDLIGSTLYVTLEPCRHFGKTPPCLDLLKKVGISKIVCGAKDPFQKSEIKIQKSKFVFLVGKIAKECLKLNKFYFTWLFKKRPFVTVKIAVTADGFVAGPKGQAIRITSAKQDKQVHQLRAEHQAILVGSGTVLADNPHLGVRLVKGKDPLRIILDSKKRIPKTAKVFRDKNHLHITSEGAKSIARLRSILKHLAKQGIASILVEPGPTLYSVLKKAKLIDKLIVLKGKKKAGKGIQFI